MIQPTVYIFNNELNIGNEEIALIASHLPPERLAKAGRYLRAVDRNNCIISYFLLLYGLVENYGIKTIPETAVGAYGKPYFINTDISFSISHCDSGVCCGISDCSIGVDIQDTDIEFEEILDIAMSQREREIITHSDAPAEAFARFWSLKECICKYRGTGINDDLNTIDFSDADGKVFSYNGAVFRFENRDNFCISSCSENQAPVFIERDLEQYIHRFLQMYHKNNYIYIDKQNKM